MSTTTVAGEIRLKRVSPEYWQVMFDLPPLNIFGPANIPQLEELVSLIETDERVKVVVFDSAIDGFFLILSFAKTPHEAILIRVTCYTASLYVIDFTCALNFGEAQVVSANQSLGGE
jgi:hypothetical protein